MLRLPSTIKFIKIFTTICLDSQSLQKLSTHQWIDQFCRKVEFHNLSLSCHILQNMSLPLVLAIGHGSCKGLDHEYDQTCMSLEPSMHQPHIRLLKKTRKLVYIMTQKKICKLWLTAWFTDNQFERSTTNSLPIDWKMPASLKWTLSGAIWFLGYRSTLCQSDVFGEIFQWLYFLNNKING